MKKNLLFISLFIIIALCGALLEGMEGFRNAVKGLRDRELPSPLLNFGRRGQIMKEMGLKYVVPLDEQVRDNGASRITMDLSRLESREEWVEAGKLPPEKMLSTRILDKQVIASGLPVLSMYMNEHDLYDKYTGIYANPLERGRNWERPCFMSYFKNGKLLFGTGAGARIHGGTSRLHPLKSFRLYFRDVYGKSEFLEGAILKEVADPVERVVLRKGDTKFGFVNSMAYDMARKIGCFSPETEPVRFYLNGKPHGHGNFELIEHLSRDYLQNHFGHKDFVYYKVKGRKDRPPEYQRFYEWARYGGASVTFEKTSEVIDMENFINYWIVNIFCANSDPYQGIALLDKRKKNPRWFWLIWDMDHSFKNIYESDKKYLWQQERPVNLVYSNTKKETDPRYFIFRRLIFHDETFRALFKKRLTEVLNYLLTNDYLQSVVDENISIARSFGMNMSKADRDLHDFMLNRPEYVIKMMNRYFKLGDVHRVRFEPPEGRTFVVDGFEIRKRFTGIYYDGSEIFLSPGGQRIKGWNINGKRYNNPSVTIPVRGDMKIRPL